MTEQTKKRLDGKVALITGAAQGMGEAHARRFVAEGAKIIVADTNENAGSAVVDSLGESAIFLQHDVTKWESWSNVISQGEEAFGTINVLVNNAGVLGPIAKTADLAEADYLKVVAINQYGVFLGMKAIIPSMLKAGAGSIVNISSIAGIVANYGFPSLAYVGSKFAVRGMTKATAIEYGSNNIRVNSVHPGFIRTPMMANATDAEGGEAVSMIPLGRIAEPREVSNLVLFLASDESSYITGAEHVIDAGMTAQ
jgi:3alpha(or 20beta)-hydroxysteroid dehydrogenase